MKGKCEKAVSDLAGDIVVSRGRPQFLPASVETNLSIFVHFMAGCNLPLDHGQIKSCALLMARDLDLIFFKASNGLEGLLNARPKGDLYGFISFFNR